MSVRGVLAAVLGFEVIVVWLFVPVAVVVSGLDAKVAVPLGVALGVACIVAAALLRRPYGIAVGTVLQVAAVALGFVVPAMFVVGGTFALLWFLTLRLGRQVDAARREREATEGRRVDGGDTAAG